MSEHQTPLFIHVKEKHFWKDVIFLFALWAFVVLLKSNNQIILLLKLIAITASLEFISFLSFHLFGKEKSLLLQGFLGGVISSTTVFIQLNYDKKFSLTNAHLLACSELIAICAMIIECIIILFAFPQNVSFKYILPFIIYLLVIVVSIISLKRSSNKLPNKTQSHSQSLEIDDPIKWMNVLKFAFYVAALRYFLSFSKNFLFVPQKLSIFIASIFEAHAVLAVSISNLTLNYNGEDIFIIIILILAGSSISKLYFVLTGPVLKSKRLVVLPILAAFAFSLLSFLA